MTSTKPSLRPVYAVFGAEQFLKRQALRRIVNLALGDDPGAMGPTRIDGETAELADALDELRTLGLLGDRRVVIVESADEFISKYRKPLETYCAKPTGDGCLILLCNSLPRNTRLRRAITESGEVIECRPLAPGQVGRWIVRRCRDASGKVIEAAAAERLRELAGNDLGMLASELDKLAAYVGGREQIAVADVEVLVGHHREETVFRVTDAMSAGDAAGALQAWEQVLATDRAAPARAIGGLAYVIRRLLDAKEAVAAGTPVSKVAPRMRQDANVLARRLKNVTVEQLQRQLCELYDTDLAAKTGMAKVERAIETFIVKHTAAGRPAAGATAGGRR